VETDENREHTPSPQSDSIPLLNFKALGPLSNSGRTGTRTGTFTRRSRKNIHILRCHHFTLLPTSTPPPVSPNSGALPPVSTQPAKRKLAICYWNFSFSAGGSERGNRKQKENKKNKELYESRCKGRTLNPNSHPVGVLPFSSKFKNRSFLRLQPEPSSLNRHHSYKTASIPTSGECAIDRVLRFSAESVQTHGATNLRIATFPFTLQFAWFQPHIVKAFPLVERLHTLALLTLWLAVGLEYSDLAVVNGKAFRRSCRDRSSFPTLFSGT